MRQELCQTVEVKADLCLGGRWKGGDWHSEAEGDGGCDATVVTGSPSEDVAGKVRPGEGEEMSHRGGRFGHRTGSPQTPGPDEVSRRRSSSSRPSLERL